MGLPTFVLHREGFAATHQGTPMARAAAKNVPAETTTPSKAGEWQALRGELVALLDQVEGRYVQVERDDPELDGLAERVRSLRGQVEAPRPAMRRNEALKTVKRAVDRFAVREESQIGQDTDALELAIAEIRGRQMSAPAAALRRQANDMPEFRELSGLVGGLSSRLARLEGELKSQRDGHGVREVASQVEQLTHVVELLAGAVGETGQVKRLEAQIGSLARLIGDAPQVDLSAINMRLDDVSATVGKLAELQAEQMEREILREDRRAHEPKPAGAEVLAPAMDAIENSVRNVYDRIDAIEKNVALGSGDFERLTSDLAAFTQAIKEREAQPSKLVAKVDALAARIVAFEERNDDIDGLKSDILALRQAVIAGMEPRFARIENQLEVLTDLAAKPVPVPDNTQVENQLKLLMERMDEAGAQLNSLASLYSAREADAPDLEALATMVAERTSDAVTRKAPAPVAMFGPESLKSIEDRIGSLIKRAGREPDIEALATLVAEKTSQAVAGAAPAAAPALSEENLSALEGRMAALFNTAGKDTAERLARLEATLREREAAQSTAAATPARETSKPSKAAAEMAGLEAMLTALAASKGDAMPANPADEAPLLDPGFKDFGPIPRPVGRPPLSSAALRNEVRPSFDPSTVEPPPRPQSSFGGDMADPFATPAKPEPATPAVQPTPSQTSTSTFVAAARRAQRAKLEQSAGGIAGGSLIGRALARVRPASVEEAAPEAEAKTAPEVPVVAEKPAKREKPKKERKPRAEAEVAPEPVLDVEAAAATTDESEPARESFLLRHRRPILLAATLAAVSMLALNLVLQRMDEAAPVAVAASTVQSAPEPAVTESADVPVEATPAEPAAAEDGPGASIGPRVIDMIDDTATGSINPAATTSFSQADGATEFPAAMSQEAIAAALAMPFDTAPAELAYQAPGIGADTSAPVQSFGLPPEAIGPIELRQAAANGDARAQFEVAAIYTEGQAIPQDFAEAAIWYERAAAQGFGPAQYRLGNLYEAGNGVEKDLEVAKLWYQRGAEAGNRMAMHNLAALYAGGQMGEQQFELAAEWFEKAATLGMTDSQFNLGMLYARGLGVEQNLEQSFKWFSLAARSGDADATKARDDVAKSLTADAVKTLDDEIAAWRAQPIDLAANYAPIGTWMPAFEVGETITKTEVVAKVQQALAKLGFDIGTPDGMAGPKTAEAIKAFERGTGMSESGAINPRLLAVLGSQPA